MCWGELPAPLLEAVADLLERPVDRHNARLVCQHWHCFMSQSMACQLEAQPDASAWGHRLDGMLARGCTFTNAEVCVSSRVLPEELEAQLQTLTQMTSLQALTLNFNLVPAKPRLGAIPPCLPPTVPLLTALTALHLANRNIPPSAAQLLSLTALGNLRSLSFHTFNDHNAHCNGITACSKLTQLQVLKIGFHLRQERQDDGLSTVDIGTEVDRAKVEAFAQLTKLQELRLQSGELTWSDLKHLAACLGQLTFLAATLAGGPNSLAEMGEAALKLLPEEPLTVIPSSRRHLAPGSPGSPLLALEWSLYDPQDSMPMLSPIVTEAIAGLAPNLQEFCGWYDEGPWPLLLPPGHPAHASLTNLQRLSSAFQDLNQPDADHTAPSTIAATFQHLSALRSLSVVINESIATNQQPDLEGWAGALSALTHFDIYDFQALPPPVPLLRVGTGGGAPLLQFTGLRSLELSVAVLLPLDALPPSLTALHCCYVRLQPPSAPLPARTRRGLHDAAGTSNSTHGQPSGGGQPVVSTGGNDGTGTGASISATWGGLPQLQSLSLHLCQVGEQTLQVLLGACPHLLALRLRDLHWAAATAAAEKTHDWVGACPPTLTSLHVVHTGGTRWVRQSDMAGVAALTRLRRLHWQVLGASQTAARDWAEEARANYQVLSVLQRLQWLELGEAFRGVDHFNLNLLLPLPLADAEG